MKWHVIKQLIKHNESMAREGARGVKVDARILKFTIIGYGTHICY